MSMFEQIHDYFRGGNHLAFDVAKDIRIVANYIAMANMVEWQRLARNLYVLAAEVEDELYSTLPPAWPPYRRRL